MNEFRTIVSPLPSKIKIGLNSGVLTIGSCFADAVGSRLTAHKFLSSANPFGVIYNPVSIHNTLQDAFGNNLPNRETYLVHDGVHLNYTLHSSFSALERETLVKEVTDSFAATSDFLKKANVVMITYGTAWVYKRADTGLIVANCHKQPAREFEKSLLTTSDIQQSFITMYDQLKKENERLRFILTVSPVRHIKDTLPLNNVSKAVLRLACHELSSAYDDVEYFPAYEMLLDDLRDYRFYNRDMIHPTEEAEDYIWNALTQTFMDDQAKEFIKEWKTIYTALQHRPFHPASSGHQIFLRQVLHKLEQLKSVINVNEEISSIRSQLLDSGNSN